MKDSIVSFEYFGNQIMSILNLHQLFVGLLLLLPIAAFLYDPEPRGRKGTTTVHMTSGSSDLQQVRAMISKAISIGAPAYNAGDIPKCASVYAATAQEIQPLLPKALGSIFEEAGKIPTTEANAKAWGFRRAFDAILEFEPPLVPGPLPAGVTLEAFSDAQLPTAPAEVMDGVMGGISEGGWIGKSNTFYGRTSLANNGGFASLRWRFPNVQNWSYAKGIYFKNLQHSKPDQHTFRIILKDETCERIRLSNFKTTFANPQASDEALLIPFSSLDQMEQMGRPLSGAPAFQPMAVTEIGIMAIKPTVVGDFQLEFSEWGLYY